MKNTRPLLTPKNTMLAAVVVFLLLATIILMGMLTPLIAKLTTGAEIRLEPGYFNYRTALPTAGLVILLSVCMLAGYLGQKNTAVIVAGYTALAAFFALISPFGNLAIDVSIPIIALALFATIYKIGRTFTRSSFVATARGASAHIIHLGILFILLGIVLSANMKMEGANVISSGNIGHFPGQDYAIKVSNMSSYYSGDPYQTYPGSAYTTEVDFDIYRNGAYFREGQVKYITDFKWGQSYTTTYIHRGLTEELFIAPRAISLQKGEVDLYMRTVPYINFLWGGFYLMVIGITALIATDYGSDRRARVPKKDKNIRGKS
ncbi:cytochrome c-type biogenesis CcmF C-terminal domain-containing protein [Methanolobus sp.]|uniref:cytochrome c-type biogenesis CcmF C-terminal domain-containing protein n=1 Tax=Methanolobus sp. TaxID=1874737 RepID=UPI0025D938BB|nr:cytochrome c-type biogenesis CcmF C-terminal domain-containing protein [Methanolobus sp.]